jgi:regulator of sigma E protease
MLILVLGAVFMLAVSIFIHELGHLLCGMLVGVKARIFSIGYGKGVWRKKIGGTTYQVTGIPLGGYVMFKGDQYGKRLKGREGELLSTPPLKRMIPVLGGPFANLVLGFLLLFVLEITGSDAPGNRIYIDPATESVSPAYQAGLRSGDRIISINGTTTKTFEDIFTAISLSSGESIQVEYLRNDLKNTLEILPNVLSSGGRPTIGIEPAGERRIVATFTYSEQISQWLNRILNPDGEAEKFYEERVQEQVKAGKLPEEILEKRKSELEKKSLNTRAIQYLNDGDVILSVNSVPIYSITELQTELGKYQGQTVNLRVDRKTLPLLDPWTRKEENVQIPVKSAYVFELKNLKHSKYSVWNINQISLASYDPDLEKKLGNLKINGKSVRDADSLVKLGTSLGGKSAKLEIGSEIYTGKVVIRPIGLLGFKPSIQFTAYTEETQTSFWGAVYGAGEKVYQNVATTLKGIGMLFSGLLSPKDNLSGPIGIVQFAGLSLEYGWRTYLDFVAKISIALMIMNLLPIPVADGGHIVMYAYEAIAGRPLPKRVMDGIFSLGFFFLIGLGIFVSFHDLLRFF